MSSPINYASAFGFHSVAGAIFFAVIYIPLFLWFVWQSFKNAAYVYIVMTLFCAMRVTAFIIRALLANSTTLGQNLGLLIADEILFSVGFSFLLYPAYILGLDREITSGAEPVEFWLVKLIRNRRLFRWFLAIGTALGIAGINLATDSDPSNVAIGLDLREAGSIVFLFLTVVQSVQTFIFLGEHIESGYSNDSRPFGDRHGNYILCAISMLLIVREIFNVATIKDQSKQNNEHLWFPLLALPEWLAVVCYAAPGLVPSRSALKMAAETGVNSRVII
ncbi:hypothetical protein DFH07DRAFT_803332 [Mycena maculata]|uniref:Uncharacterized protein n=1 Tax=Mycena maculata TaxID=230809 RepID=A0AAD7NQZ8_9AGAR|nr:hypothetical protein DFH07DRAFT_803332 [Mycena maculata]